MSSINEISACTLDQPQENLLKDRVEEIEKLEKIVDESLIEIESLQIELRDLEGDLNVFLDKCYGTNAVFFKPTENTLADNDNSSSMHEAKRNLYEKIARVCAQDGFSLNAESMKEGLLKIEGYLAEGKEQSQSPQDLLSNLVFECYNLMQQIRELKEKKQNLLDSPAYELKQEVMWANIKAAETISKIKEELTHHVNKLN